MTLTLKKSVTMCSLSHLTTSLFLYVLFCVFSVCYDVRLSHLNKNYLLTYLSYILIFVAIYNNEQS